jgi:hypothetical protein
MRYAILGIVVLIGCGRNQPIQAPQPGAGDDASPDEGANASFEASSDAIVEVVDTDDGSADQFQAVATDALSANAPLEAAQEARLDASQITCPASFEEARGGGTGDPGQLCSYAEGRCVFMPCTRGTTTTTWLCRTWSEVGDECPMPAPSSGSSCGNEGAFCDYTPCCLARALGDSMECMNGKWTPRPSTCPAFCTYLCE